MYFTKIELQNFGIYKGTHTMALQNGIGHRNITLVGGMNGRGKTTILDAILLCLYDKQAMNYIQEKARSYERLLTEHINMQANGEDTFIAISLVLEDNTKLYIKRSWKQIGKKLQRELLVEKNGILDKHLAENWNYYMEAVLPFGIAKFFFFNNEKITQLADDTSFEQIKESIKSAIGISTIEKALTHIDEVMRRKQTAIDNFQESDTTQAFHSLEEQLSAINDDIQETERLIEEQHKVCDKINARCTLKEKEFWESGGDLGRNRDKIKEEKAKLDFEMATAKMEMQKLASNPATPLLLCRDLVSSTYNAEKQTLEQETRRRSDNLLNDIYIKLMERVDHARCSNKMRNLVREMIEEEIGALRSTVTEEGVCVLSDSTMLILEQIISEKFHAITSSIEELLRLDEERENELVSLDAHLGNTDDKTLGMQLFQALQGLQGEKGVAQDTLEKLVAQLDDYKQKRDTFHAQRTKLVMAMTEKGDANDDDIRILKYAAMSTQVLDEFKLQLQQRKIAALSETTTSCFHRLVEKDSLIQHIAIDHKTLDIKLIGGNGQELLKTQLSAGEQQMFAVSIIWALALTSGYKAPVFVDTPMARLDSGHRTNFVSKYLPDASSQVIVLSTDEEVYGKYLDLIRENIMDYYTLLYHEEERCTTIVSGYFQEV